MTYDTFMGKGCLAKQTEKNVFKVFIYRTSVNKGTDCFAGNVYMGTVIVPEENETDGKYKPWEIAVGLLEDAIRYELVRSYTKKSYLTLNELSELKQNYFNS